MKWWKPKAPEEASAPVKSAPADAAPYKIRQTSAHRWQLLKLYPTPDGRGCYSYPFPAAGDCLNHDEAKRFLRYELTGKFEYLDEPEDPPTYYTEMYDAAGQLLSAEGERLTPSCAPPPTGKLNGREN